MRLTLLLTTSLLLATPALAKDIPAADPKSIRAAMQAAQPGDTIAIPPGDYDMGDALVAGVSGTKDLPITLRTAGETGYAKLKITGKTDVGFRILAKFWTLRGLHIQGANPAILDLIQIDGSRGGSDLTMVDCRISHCKEFLLKASRSREQASDNVLLDHCEWFDCPETAIDLVSGDNWIIRHNYVHDYGTDGAAHYAIFLKGGGKNGLIESNLVDAKKQKGTVGISFGGGLTGAKWLPLLDTGKVAPEHKDGICRNNIVVNTTDVAYHANNASNCKFYNNLAYNCRGGFQRQGGYAPDPAVINSVFSGSIHGAGESQNNVTKVDEAWFVAPEKNDFRLTDIGKAALAGNAQPLKNNPADFLSNPRPTPPDLGPLNATATQSPQWLDRRQAK